MNHRSSSVPDGNGLEPQRNPSATSTDGADSRPKFENTPPKHVLEEIARLEAQATRGKPIEMPDSFPADQWSHLSDHEKAEVAARHIYGEEDWAWIPDEGLPPATEPGSQDDQGWDIFIGPELDPLSIAVPPDSMVGDGEATPTPWEIWKKIEKIAQSPACGSLPDEEARNLWLVYTGRKGKLLLLVCEWERLKEYAGGVQPCPVLIQGHPGLTTLTGEVTSLRGWRKFGFAANTIRRLAYFYDDQAFDQSDGSAEDATD